MIYFKWYCIVITSLLIINIIVDLFRVVSSKKWYSYIEDKLKTAYLHPDENNVICFEKEGSITKVAGIMNSWDIDNVGPVLKNTKLSKLIEKKYNQLLEVRQRKQAEANAKQIKIYF